MEKPTFVRKNTPEHLPLLHPISPRHDLKNSKKKRKPIGRVRSFLSVDLFDNADKILIEGDLMKFKPGISLNFIPRYVQISQRGFRYFKNKHDAFRGKPIIVFRKKII